jgi:ribosomal protein S6
MSKEQQIDQTEQDTDSKVYELGFHFVPTIAEDDVAVQFSHLKSMIEKRGGEFISEDFPKMIPLAYEISKTVKAQKKRYTNAYFGWVKFTLTADQIGDLEKEVKAFEPILRYLVISTVKESTLLETKEDKKEKEEGETVNEAQLDKKLEELSA